MKFPAWIYPSQLLKGALGRGNFSFAQFLTLNTRFTLHLICLFAQNHRFDFCQIPSIMILNFLNSDLLCFNFKRSWLLCSAHACFIGGYGVQDLCKWFNLFHIHYRVKFSDHALCFIQFLRVVSFQAPTVKCPIEKNGTRCFWFSTSRGTVLYIWKSSVDNFL